MMKKILYIVLLISSIAISTSCDDFLEVKPRNTKIVKTVKDYRDILASYMDWLKDITGNNIKVLGNNYGFPKFDLSDIMPIYSGEIQYKEGDLIDPTTGEIKVFEDKMLNWSNTNIYAWTNNYQFLGPINFIIQEIDKAQINVGETSEETSIMRNYVKGEALVWRAYVYFKTLQYYAPYKDPNIGIPLNIKAYEDPINYEVKRNTQKEVYDLIISDCNKVLELLEETPKEIWNFAYDKSFVHAMLTSIYMYKAMSGAAEETDYAKVVEFADKAMQGRKLNADPVNLNKMFDMSDATGYQKYKGDEVFIRIIKKNCFAFSKSKYVRSSVTLDFYNTYADDDIRKQIYFTNYNSNIVTSKYEITQSIFSFLSGRGGLFMPYRLADVYLMKAEALIRSNQHDKAIPVLTEFKQGRYTNPVVVPTEKEELLKEVLKERKLEFYLENDMRWLDMKRLSEKFDRGTIIGTNYLLQPNDYRYTFPIPIDEFLNNSKLKQNPGWEHIIK